MSRRFTALMVTFIAALAACSGARGAVPPEVGELLPSLPVLGCKGVPVPAGTTLPDAAEDNPPGTVFCVSGTQHVGRPVVPKDGQEFHGPAVLIGNGTEHAFTGRARDVVLRDLTVEGFEPRVQDAAVDGEDGRGWVMEDLEVRRNGGVGLSLGTDSVVRDSFIHHNAQLGIKGRGDGGLVEGNQIAFNNYREEYSWGWEAGGSKFWSTSNYVVRDNHWHHNAGPGIWFDNDNTGALIEDNLVEDNYDNGIFWEISYDAVIRGNTVRRNGARSAFGWRNGAGIMISASGGIDGDLLVEDNSVTANKNGIVLQQQERGAGDRGPYLVRNVLVRSNTVDLRAGGNVGLVEDVAGDAPFDRNNRFRNNTYTLSSTSVDHFDWEGGPMRWSEWRAVFPTESRA